MNRFLELRQEAKLCENPEKRWLNETLDEIERLTAENERLDRDLSQTIGERDRAEEQATSLANMVGRFFELEVGEHSNLNCPIENACEFLNEQLANRTAVRAPVDA